MLALSMYYSIGGKGYRFCRYLFPLPSVLTLNRMIKNIPLTPGLGPAIEKHMATLASKMTKKQKVCVLLWDEVHLKRSLSYSKKAGNIIGHEDWGTNRTYKTANHALVFMLRGIDSGWTIPLSFSFCDKSTSGPQLARCIKTHAKAVDKADFNLIGIFFIFICIVFCYFTLFSFQKNFLSFSL